MKRFWELGGHWLIAQAMMFAMYTASILYDDGALSSIPIGGRLIGAALVVLGLIGTLWAVVALGGSLTPFPAPTRSNRLVTHGPYRIVRHPIYGCIVIAFVGGGILFGDAAPLTVAIVMLAFVAGKSSYEERALAGLHPDYQRYREAVRWRILPWIV